MLLFLALLAAPATPADAPQDPGAPLLVADVQHASFGEEYQFGSARHVFVFRNDGDHPVTIREAQTRTGGIDARISFERGAVRPGASAAVTVEQPLGDRLGLVSFRYRITTDGPSDPPVRFSLSGFVQSAYLPERTFVEMGTIDPRAGASQAFDLASDEAPRLQLLGVLDAPPGVTVEVVGPSGEADEGLRLRLRVAPSARSGLLGGKVRLATNVAHQPRYELAFRAALYAEVVPSVVPLDFGGAVAGSAVVRTFELRSRSGGEVRVERIRDGAGLLTLSAEPCDEAAASCVRVRASLAPSAGAAPGSRSGEVIAELAGGTTVAVPWSAMLFVEGSEVRVLGGPGVEP